MSTDSPIITPRLGLKEMGLNNTLEPAQYNTLITAVDASAAASALANTAFTKGTGVTMPTQQPASLAIQRIRLQLTAARVTVTAANDFGSLDIMTWPNTNIFVVNGRCNLVGTKDGTGIVAAATPLVAVGSVAAAAADLGTTTQIDTIGEVTMAGTLSAAVQKNGNDLSTLRRIAAGASNKLFLNVGIAITADGFIDFTGTIDISFIDLGLFS